MAFQSGCSGEKQNILESVKKDLGASEWDDAFDDTLIRHINTVFMILNQLGVGRVGFVANKDSTWDEFIDGGEDIEGVKTYVYKRVKLIFDPSQSSSANDADKAICDELEWRMNVAVDPRC